MTPSKKRNATERNRYGYAETRSPVREQSVGVGNRGRAAELRPPCSQLRLTTDCCGDSYR